MKVPDDNLLWSFLSELSKPRAIPASQPTDPLVTTFLPYIQAHPFSIPQLPLPIKHLLPPAVPRGPSASLSSPPTTTVHFSACPSPHRVPLALEEPSQVQCCGGILPRSHLFVALLFVFCRYGCWPSTSLHLPQGLACSHCGQEDSSLGAPPACGGRVPRRVGPLDTESGRVAAAFSRKLEAAASQGGRTDSREAPGPVGGALGVLKGRALAGRTGLGDSRGEVCMGVPSHFPLQG